MTSPRGSLYKLSLISLKKIPFATILGPRDPLGDQRVEDNSTQEFVTQTTGESGGNTGTVRLTKLLGAGGSKLTKSR